MTTNDTLADLRKWAKKAGGTFTIDYAGKGRAPYAVTLKPAKGKNTKGEGATITAAANRAWKSLSAS